MQHALDGLAMLLVNVIMLLIGGMLTRTVQRMSRVREGRSTTTADRTPRRYLHPKWGMRDCCVVITFCFY